MVLEKGITIDFSVIIPAYNEAVAIQEVLRRLLAYLKEQQISSFEIRVVDDGSEDQTAAEAHAAGPQIQVIQHPYNLGNGAAVKTGIRRAKGEILICMDADGQHQPEDLLALLEGCRRCDMVVGTRSRKDQAGWHRYVANTIYNQFASYVTGRPVADLTSGFRAIKREVAQRFVGLLPNGYSYPTTITLSLMRAGYSVSYKPIQTQRRKGKSKINLLGDGTKFLLVIMKICMLFAPLKIFLPVSLYLFLMGVGYYGYTFTIAHRFTNMSMLLFTTAVMVFMMGLIAEQIAQMRFEQTEAD